jgi:hypothetical protein
MKFGFSHDWGIGEREKEASAVDVKRFTEKDWSCMKQCLLRFNPPPNDQSELLQKIRILKASLVCYNVWSGFLKFRKHHAPSQIWELLIQWHIAEDMNATAVRTWRFPQIWKTRMSNVSAVVVSLTIRPLYPGWWHPLPINSGFLCGPQRRCGRFDQEIFNVCKCLLPCQIYIK